MARARSAPSATLAPEDIQELLDRGTVERVLLSSVIPWDGNPREHDEVQLDMLVKSIKAHGFCAPLVVQASSGKLVAGHGRRLALLRIANGHDPLVAVVKASLTDEQAIAYALADNRIAELSTWNIPLLREAVTLLDDGAFDFEAIGYTPEAMNELFSLPAPGSGILPGKDPEDAPHLPTVASSRLGDLYLLGRHRLLCGDSTSADDVARLMDGEHADCLLTDPPYGVAYKSDSKKLKAGGKASIKNDELDPAALETFLTQAFMCAFAACSPRVGCYVFYPSRYHREFENALNAAKFEVRAQIIWAKTQASFGFAQYKWKHEPILFVAKPEQIPLVFVPSHEAAFYAFKTGQSVAWEGDRSQTTVWTCSRETGYVHPTQKPVELLQRPIKNSTRPRGIVLDLFGGSGSTLMACEVLGRTACLMELDPLFVDVIVARWENATGKQATLVRSK